MEDLVERARAGDREAFGSLVAMTSDRMYAIAIRMLRDGHLAEDALQGALIAAWRQLPTLRDPMRSVPALPAGELLERHPASLETG